MHTYLDMGLFTCRRVLDVRKFGTESKVAHVYVHVYAHVYVHVHTQVYVHICAHVYTQVHTHVYPICRRYWVFGNLGTKKGTCWLKPKAHSLQVQRNRDAGSAF